MTTNLVVADKRRTDKTICLAVTLSLKAYGISPGQPLRGGAEGQEVNLRRQAGPRPAVCRRLLERSEVRENPALALDLPGGPTPDGPLHRLEHEDL